MFEMTREQWREFLSEESRTGKLATVRKDGRPHVMPVWFILDDDDSLVFTTGGETVKAKTLQRTGQAMLCVDDEAPPYAFVTVEGSVELSDDVGQLLEYATRIGGKYMGPDRAQEFGERNGVPGELLVRLHAEKVLGYGDLTG